VADALTSGARIGSYEVIDRLGAGGMGEVYRARDTRLGRPVAIKVLRRGADPELLRRLEREARAASALNHPNIVHRDLKPENVMVTPEGVVMSPEQASGRTVDHRTDQFSLGLILHEMATGRPSFRRDPPAQVPAAVIERDPEPLGRLRPDVPAALESLVSRCLQKDPERRFARTDELASELAALAGLSRSVSFAEASMYHVEGKRGVRSYDECELAKLIITGVVMYAIQGHLPFWMAIWGAVLAMQALGAAPAPWTLLRRRRAGADLRAVSPALPGRERAALATAVAEARARLARADLARQLRLDLSRGAASGLDVPELSSRLQFIRDEVDASEEVAEIGAERA
jgi:hypothetical protein